MLMNVFSNEPDAINAQALDFAIFKSKHSDKPAEYWAITTQWDEVKKRADADEWFYLNYALGIQTHQQKEAELSWYSAEEV